MIYNMYIFDRKGACLYYKEWQRPLNSMADDPQEERKLMFGMLYSIKTLVQALASKSASPNAEGLQHLRTNGYTLHYLETPSGLRFVVNTDNSISDMRSQLRHFYAGLWVEHVVKSPQWSGPGAQLPVQFDAEVEKYVTSLPGFR